MCESKAALEDLNEFNNLHMGQFDKRENLERFLYRFEEVVYRQGDNRPNEKLLEQKLRAEASKDPKMTQIISMYEMRANLGRGSKRSYLGLMSLIKMQIQAERRERNSAMKTPHALTVVPHSLHLTIRNFLLIQKTMK